MKSTNKHSLLQHAENKAGWLFITPWIIGFLLFSAYPIGAAIYYSFTNYNIVDASEFQGLSNYIKLFQDSNFMSSLWNSIYFMLIGIPVCNIIALVAAFLLCYSTKGRSFFRTVYFLPVMMPAVASSVLWKFMFNPQYGVFNNILSVFGLDGSMWLNDASTAKPALILMSTWSVGKNIILYFTAMLSVPVSYYEAADIDGAGKFKQFMRITFPLITPIVFFNLVTNMIASFQYFTEPYLMTQGGPNGSTMTFALYLYRTAFENLDMGYACSMGCIQLVIILAYTLFMFKLQNKWVTYQ